MYKVIESHNKNLLTPEMRKELGIEEEVKKEEEKKELSFVILNDDDFKDFKDIKNKK